MLMHINMNIYTASCFETKYFKNKPHFWSILIKNVLDTYLKKKCNLCNFDILFKHIDYFQFFITFEIAAYVSKYFCISDIVKNLDFCGTVYRQLKDHLSKSVTEIIPIDKTGL